MKGLLGIKIGMTQIFSEAGSVTPVTLIQAGPCYITQVKTESVDGYNALQVGFGDIEEKRLTKGEKGHLGLLKIKKSRSNNSTPALRHLREFRTKSVADYRVGQLLKVDQFTIGERVDVVGTTKGRGFAGNVKRHGFAGGPKTHGQSDRMRAPGSVAGTSGVSHIFKGKRMAGRMGNERCTVQNLEVVRIDTDRNLIAVKGAIPGAKGSLVILRDAAKG